MVAKNLPAIQETWVRSMGQEDSLEKGMATDFSILSGEFHGQRSLAEYSPYYWHDWETLSHFSYWNYVQLYSVSSKSPINELYFHNLKNKKEREKSFLKCLCVWYEYCYSNFLMIYICIEYLLPSPYLQSLYVPRSEVVFFRQHICRLCFYIHLVNVLWLM